MFKSKIIRVLETDNVGTLRIVIPKDIREKLNIKSGDYLFVTYDKQDRIILKKVGDKN